MSLSISQTNTMVSLFRQELELCKVKPGETVAVLSEAEQAVEYASAFMIATRELGWTCSTSTCRRVARVGRKTWPVM